mmetsp:Transcript_28391/g.42222  ORF Transcript_28391/g.42222 Transcript_28391/m.42222 type:complete len:230 (+) Transcript_28391:221-910(+)
MKSFFLFRVFRSVQCTILIQCPDVPILTMCIILQNGHFVMVLAHTHHKSLHAVLGDFKSVFALDAEVHLNMFPSRLVVFILFIIFITSKTICHSNTESINSTTRLDMLSILALFLSFIVIFILFIVFFLLFLFLIVSTTTLCKQSLALYILIVCNNCLVLHVEQRLDQNTTVMCSRTRHQCLSFIFITDLLLLRIFIAICIFGVELHTFHDLELDQSTHVPQFLLRQRL